MEDKKSLKEVKTIFNSLKIDPSSVLLSEERVDNRLLKKLKKSKYLKDAQLLQLMNLADNKDFLNDDKISTRTDEINKSTLYSFDGPFQLLHADVGNLEFFSKNATFPQYVLVAVVLYASKVYVYSMRSRKQILQKIKLFYDEVKEKRKGKRMRLQVDIEFQQVKIKYWNNEKNLEMLVFSLTGGKAFAAKQT